MRAPRLDALARVPLTAERVRKAVRLLRGRVFVHTALAERKGRSPLETGRLWSDAADAAIGLAASCAAQEVEAKQGPSGMGRAVFALGKLGSRELNPSSDVDLLAAYERDGDVPSGKTSAHEWHVQWVRKMRALLHDVDADGFAFRVDLDLRPEGTQGPLVNSVDALESYYERFGQTWERAALLRLRAVHDVDGVGVEVMRRVRPFVFPRSVDAKAVDELFAMKTRVTASAGSEGFDVKRGRGGIREVEFVVQANQMLHGGKLAGLRTGNIVELLDKLEEHGLIPHKTSVELSQGYLLLRRVEHALQYGEDRQTQTLPDAGSERERVERALADVVGRRVPFAEVLEKHRADVHTAFERVLGENREAPNQDARRALDRTLDSATRIEALRALGFSDSARALDLVHLLERRRGSPLAPVEAKAADALDAGAHLIESVARSPDPMAALARLPDLFLERVPRASLSAITADKRTLALAARLLATSAPLSRMLAKHHGLDEVLARGLATPRLRKGDVRAEVAAETASVPPWAGGTGVPPVIARAPTAAETGVPSVIARAPTAGGTGVPPVIARAPTAGGTGVPPVIARANTDAPVDEEARFVAMRRAHSRRTLAIALAFFGGRVDAPAAGLALSTLADALLEEAVALAHAKIHARHGAIEGAKFAVIGLGSLGGRELGFFRDLDLLFVYESEPALAADESTGPKRIGIGEHAARTAQQVIWAVAAPLAEGACYAVDSRLRPSGGQGALTTSLATFASYHESASAPWERQALLRARHVAGDRALGLRAVEAAKRAALRAPEAGLGMRLLDMRARMVAERASQGGLDLKMGEGGLADVEFAVQGLQLAHGHRDPLVWTPSTRRALGRLARRGHLNPQWARDLEKAWRELSLAREALALVDDKREPAVSPTDARLDLLVRAGVLEGTSGSDCYDRLAKAAATVRDLTGRILVRLG